MTGGVFQLQQICKILNAHMDSLQWVEQNSGWYTIGFKTFLHTKKQSVSPLNASLYS